MEQIIFNDEYGRVRAPVLPGYMGVSLAGPTIMQWGTEEQKRYFLPGFSTQTISGVRVLRTRGRF